jgi:hypothetical protein
MPRNWSLSGDNNDTDGGDTESADDDDDDDDDHIGGGTATRGAATSIAGNIDGRVGVKTATTPSSSPEDEFEKVDNDDIASSSSDGEEGELQQGSRTSKRPRATRSRGGSEVAAAEKIETRRYVVAAAKEAFSTRVECISNFTMEDDRKILYAWKRRGSSTETWKALSDSSDPLERVDKPPNEIQRRFHELLCRFKEQQSRAH